MDVEGRSRRRTGTNSAGTALVERDYIQTWTDKRVSRIIALKNSLHFRLLYPTCSFDTQSRYRSFHQTLKSWLSVPPVQLVLSEYLEPVTHRPQRILRKSHGMPPWRGSCKDRVSTTAF